MKKSVLRKLSPELRKLIIAEIAPQAGTLSSKIKKSVAPVSAFAHNTLKHCNGGATLAAALWLKNHLDSGGKLVVTISGALSSFQIGTMLAELVLCDKEHL